MNHANRTMLTDVKRVDDPTLPFSIRAAAKRAGWPTHVAKLMGSWQFMNARQAAEYKANARDLH